MPKYAPITFTAGVLMGTASAITSKVLYGVQAVGSSGNLQYFEKPLLMTLVMFVAMICALPLYWALEWRERRARSAKAKAVHGGDMSVVQGPTSDDSGTSWRAMLILIAPATFDLLATALGSIGLMFTTVSVYQLIRCSIMIVTALIKAVILREKLKTYMWVGIGINTIATILVSMVNFMPDHADVQPGPYRDPRIGVMFILASCVVQASQYVFEEKLMRDDSTPPLVVVGMEGVWGAAIMVLVVMPWAGLLPGSDQGGCIENAWDAWVMTTHSTTIQALLAFFFVTVSLYNIFAIYVTFLLDSIWHAILETFRPCAVWGTDLLIFYVVTSGHFGEAWTRWSIMQLVGMIIMMLGTAIFNASIHLPFIDYEEEDEEDERGGGKTHTPPPTYTSDPITSSPLISKNARVRRLSGVLPSIQNLTHGSSSSLLDEASPLHHEEMGLGGGAGPSSRHYGSNADERHGLLTGPRSNGSSPHLGGLRRGSSGDRDRERGGSKAKGKQSSHAQVSSAAQ